MYPETDACPLEDFSMIGSQHFIFDLIYNPARTKLMLKGEERGAKTLNGLPMLGFQAEKSWEIWNDNTL
jgi:shikimate dehydrogenase